MNKQSEIINIINYCKSIIIIVILICTFINFYIVGPI